MPREIIKMRLVKSHWKGQKQTRQMKQGDCKTGQEGLNGGHLALPVVFANLNELPVKLLSGFLRNY